MILFVLNRIILTFSYIFSIRYKKETEEHDFSFTPHSILT